MQVEIFECHENASEPVEVFEETVRIIEGMRLDGQKNLVSWDSEQQARRPYRKWTKDEQLVYTELCPKKYRIEDYDRSPIPLSVLRFAENSLEFLPENYRLYVLDRAEIHEECPVLVASKYSWDFGSDTYILARWGEHLDNFKTMLNLAVESKRKRLKYLLNVALAEIENSDSVLDLRYEFK